MNSRQHVPPYSAPRCDTERDIYAPPANHWLRMVYAALKRIRCLLTCEQTTQEVSASGVPEGDTIDALGENVLSRAVVVCNTGSRGLRVFEGGALVMIVPPGKTKTMPTAGKLAIAINIWDNDGNEGSEVFSSFSAVRYLRCLCGDIAAEYDSEPVGGFLL